MYNASHRHVKDSAVKAPRAPWGTLALVFVLIVALFGGLLLASALATPANASTGYLQPAVTAARTVDRGYTGNGDRVTQWQHVKRHCRKVGCIHPSAAIMRDLGYGPRHPALMHVGDTSFIWVKLSRGRVRTFTS